MQTIPLTQGKVAIVDDMDYSNLIVRSWCYSNGYAWAKIDGKKQSMHRFLMNNPNGLEIDHINNNGCDNRRCNLRIATRSQNMANLHLTQKRTSRFKGVCFNKYNSKWHAAIRINGKKKHLGYFLQEQDAAKAYDSAAKQYFGEFAHINFPN